MATETMAEKIASEGVEALDKHSKNQLADAEDYIAKAGKHMDEIRPIINKVNEGTKLSRPEQQKLLTEVGFTREILKERMEAPPDNQWVKRFNNENPRAYFYVDCSDGSRLMVVAYYRGKTRLIPDTDEDFE